MVLLELITGPLQEEEYPAPRGQGYLKTSGEDQMEDLANYEASFAGGATQQRKKTKPRKKVEGSAGFLAIAFLFRTFPLLLSDCTGSRRVHAAPEAARAPFSPPGAPLAVCTPGGPSPKSAILLRRFSLAGRHGCLGGGRPGPFSVPKGLWTPAQGPWARWWM